MCLCWCQHIGICFCVYLWVYLYLLSTIEPQGLEPSRPEPMACMPFSDFAQLCFCFLYFSGALVQLYLIGSVYSDEAMQLFCAWSSLYVCMYVCLLYANLDECGMRMSCLLQVWLEADLGQRLNGWQLLDGQTFFSTVAPVC